MLADQLDYVIGVDPHRDTHALAVVEVLQRARSLFEATVACRSKGGDARGARARGAARARPSRVRGRRRPASYGVGLTRFLTGSDEQVFEVGRLRRQRCSGGKTDKLDAIRAAQSALSRSQASPAIPRAGGEREAIKSVARRPRRRGQRKDGRSTASCATCSFTTPEPFRSELRLLKPRAPARLA